MFLEGFKIAIPGKLVNGCILVELLTLGASNNIGSRNNLYVYLHTLSRIHHLLVGLLAETSLLVSVLFGNSTITQIKSFPLFNYSVVTHVL